MAVSRALYERYVLPHVVHAACGSKPAMQQRSRVVPVAHGRVLEIGFGSGLNLPFYDPDSVKHLWALEPSGGMHAKARRAVRRSPVDIEPIEAPAEAIPLDNHCVDTVVITYTLCTIGDVPRALAEIRRVLKRRGDLLFCEHGAAPDRHVRWWQRHANPLWRVFGGGCHLDRPIPALVEEGGFRIRDLDTGYLPGWRPATFNYLGRARPR